MQVCMKHLDFLKNISAQWDLAAVTILEPVLTVIWYVYEAVIVTATNVNSMISNELSVLVIDTFDPWTNYVNSWLQMA